MLDPFEPEPCLDLASHAGTEVVANVTRYLSTLPQPVEIIEELVSVCSVTASLLKTLNSAINQFDSTAQLCPRTSFISPLYYDISVVLKQFTQKMSEAQELKVFEPNDVGLVRVPRNGWAFVLGSEAKVGLLRSRLYVEKYRVRALIDAVTWFGLKNLGSSRRTAEQESDFETLKKMLPFIADRFVGIWRDYKPRLESGNQNLGNFNALTVQSPRVTMHERILNGAAFPSKQEVFKRGSQVTDEKAALYSSPSSASLASYCSGASSVTIADDSIKERWILRRSETRRALTSRTHILGVPFQSTYSHTPVHYYVQPLSSHASEVDSLLISQTIPITQAILALPDDAQREIQSLLESRQNASSSGSILRSWEVLACQVRPRRKIIVSGNKNWWQIGQKSTGPLEWVLVIKGVTVDHKTRTMPVRSEDPWNPRPRNVTPQALPTLVPTVPNPYVQARQQQMFLASRFAMPSAPGAHVLRHVEQKRGISLEEAEDKLTELLGDLFKFRNRDAEKKVPTDEQRDRPCKAHNATYTSDP